MRKLILILLAFMVSGACFSQKIKERKVDKFNGSVMIRTSDESIVKFLGFTSLDVFGRKIKSDTNTVYSITFLFKAESALSVRNYDSVYLKFGNGSLMSLPYMFKYEFYGHDDIVYYTCELTVDKLNVLISNRITDLRFENSSYNRDFEIKEKYRQVIPNVCRLLINEN